MKSRVLSQIHLWSAIIIGVFSITFGEVIKNNTYFLRNVNIYYIEIGFFIFCMIAFTLTYSFYDYGKYVKGYNLENEDVKDKPHKQTYLEYVLERKQVERILK